MTSDQWRILRHVCGWLRPEDPEFTRLGDRMNQNKGLRDELIDFVSTFPVISSPSGQVLYKQGREQGGIEEALEYITDPLLAEAAGHLLDRLADLDMLSPTAMARAELAERSGAGDSVKDDDDVKQFLKFPPVDFAAETADRGPADQGESASDYTLDFDDAFLHGDNPLEIVFTSTRSERAADEAAMRRMCKGYGYEPSNDGIHFGNVLAYISCVFEAGRQLEKGEIDSVPKSRFVVERAETSEVGAQVTARER